MERKRDNFIIMAAVFGTPLALAWLLILVHRAAPDPFEAALFLCFGLGTTVGFALVFSKTRRLIAIIAWSLFLCSYSALLLTSCAGCSTETDPWAVSPDGRHMARVMESDGGAADTFHTWVHLRSRWSLRPSETVFTAELPPGLVALRWSDDSHLRISHAPAAPYHHPSECFGPVDGIEISCETEETPSPARAGR